MSRDPSLEFSLSGQEMSKLLDRATRTLPFDTQILGAFLVGSRAWKMASPTSDFDIRIIFRYPMATYLSLDRRVRNQRLDCTGIMDDDTQLSVDCKDWFEFCQHLWEHKVYALEILHGIPLPLSQLELPEIERYRVLTSVRQTAVRHSNPRFYARSFEGMVVEHVARYLVEQRELWTVKTALHAWRALKLSQHFAQPGARLILPCLGPDGLEKLPLDQRLAWTTLVAERRGMPTNPEQSQASFELLTQQVKDFYLRYKEGVKLVPPSNYPNPDSFSALFRWGLGEYSVPR